MIEYLYNAVILQGEDELTATITDKDGKVITKDCSLSLYNDYEVIQDIVGTFNSETNIWHFPIESIGTGRYFYTINLANEPMQFKQPIYFK